MFTVWKKKATVVEDSQTTADMQAYGQKVISKKTSHNEYTDVYVYALQIHKTDVVMVCIPHLRA